ncbi:hypothetical protein CNE_1c12360 [Cupriavidus necator N-1]|jgi:hypothetical protein|uniref:Uncharacterized protein n=1 Tax=Cupriavidus necator (strain ATCC 43291 / DSM 13513 / CCUG 52238 / LMG 8453 / N-1) TaxID=1042878 RepID=G0ERF3_CUPNN|nr:MULTISPECIES: hypothetical protein [Cupriavidus]AEI76590.1 hypothetical protein CNE_1c12360 [Cupriavidus necator N-1]KAI3597756.1 hypothetical protein D8I24_6572 [Cupriavidus necator H850]MDX6011288.1 hypothetical protein [Cupriavidus necator]QUN29583.1 hypothetical protein KB879_06455 [Cupriavidus sp. KK10]
MPISTRCLATGLLALAWASPALAQPAPADGAAGAISEAVQGGASPYRPPSAASPDPDDAARAKCEALKEQYNATSKKRSYQSSGPATQNAQGRTIPKIERDKTRKQLQQAYRDNCT